MSSILRLVVGAGLFAFGYYLGRQSCRFESLEDQPGGLEVPVPAPEPDKVDSE